MSLTYYTGLLVWRDRIETFRRAIEEEVRPGDRVLDLGTGLGTFAFFAAGAGAKRVWGVESKPVVHVAQALAVENGLDDRVELLRGRAPDVELPEPVDLLIFEAFPRKLLDEKVWRLLRRVSEDTLAPDARMLPRAARLKLAPLHAPRLRRWLFPLEDDSGSWREQGIDWSVVRDYMGNQPRYVSIRSKILAADPVSGPRIPLLPLPRAEDLTVEGRWVLSEGGPVEALAFWFDLEVGRGRWTTNEPEAKDRPWGQVVLPLDPPLQVEPGGILEAGVEREAFSDGAPGWITWWARSGDQVVKGHEFAAYPAALEDLYGS